MGIVRITEEDVKKNVRNYRIKQTFFVLGVMAVSVIIIVSLIVYYNIKQRALVGALYLSDENSAVQLVNNLMYLNINKYTLQAGSDAMLEAGYSAKGYTYLLRINGELVSYIVIALILAVILIYGLISCYKIGKKDYMGQIKLIAGKNVSLKEELNKEHEYNKIQYKKMQEFVENIAHQIKTPLSVITMKLEMIQELCGINEDICRLITDCTKNTFKIKMFIKKLLDISRIESGKITLSSDEIVIDYIVEESVECSVDDKQKVSVNYGNEDRHRKMYADEGWLLEALINVISNCYRLIPEYTAYENIVLPLILDNKDIDGDEVRELMSSLQIEYCYEKYPYEMSGGEQQRVAIARALINHPAVVYADEPTGNLDAGSSENVAAMLALAASKYRQTIIMVTHDKQMAGYADRVLSIVDGNVSSEVNV